MAPQFFRSPGCKYKCSFGRNFVICPSIGNLIASVAALLVDSISIIPS